MSFWSGLLKTPRRVHIAKTISWRIVAFITTFFISWILTGNIWAGVAIGGADSTVKLFLYYAHERAWYRWKPAAAAISTSQANNQTKN